MRMSGKLSNRNVCLLRRPQNAFPAIYYASIVLWVSEEASKNSLENCVRQMRIPMV